MTFSDIQIRRLRSPVKRKNIREREIEGKRLSYLEGWHVISEANRIFGFDAWDRETVSSECVCRRPVGDEFTAAYLTRVRIKVRAGGSVVVREGLGSGEATAPTPGQAHEWASKAAETDATKRALSTFGNSFGLSLYRGKTEPIVVDFGAEAHALADEPEQIDTDVGAVSAQPAVPTTAPVPHANIIPKVSGDAVELPLDSKNDDAVRAMSDPQRGSRQPSDLARKLARLPIFLPPVIPPSSVDRRVFPAKIEKSALTFSEPKRVRSRDHLRFVAAQPCLVCGRTPSQAHHMRFMQPRAMARKVSDEFTVPLCATHHHALHQHGNERNWWELKNVEPVAIAQTLWQESRNRTDESAAE